MRRQNLLFLQRRDLVTPETNSPGQDRLHPSDPASARSPSRNLAPMVLLHTERINAESARTPAGSQRRLLPVRLSPGLGGLLPTGRKTQSAESGAGARLMPVIPPAVAILRRDWTWAGQHSYQVGSGDASRNPSGTPARQLPADSRRAVMTTHPISTYAGSKDQVLADVPTGDELDRAVLTVSPAPTTSRRTSAHPRPRAPAPRR